jgi:hypothetical protein
VTSKSKSWRDILPVHPAADLFPLMKDTDPAGLKALGQDIKKNGLTSPLAITATEGPHGWRYSLVDGRNRLDAMETAGISIKLVRRDDQCSFAMHLEGGQPDHPVSTGLIIDGDPYAYVVSANIHRRHLTPEQKHELIKELIKQQPNKSDRQIAEQAKASPTTVGKNRKELEVAGKVSTVDSREDKRGARRPAHPRPPEPPTDPHIADVVERAERRSEETRRRQAAIDSIKSEPPVPPPAPAAGKAPTQPEPKPPTGIAAADPRKPPMLEVVAQLVNEHGLRMEAFLAIALELYASEVIDREPRVTSDHEWLDCALSVSDELECWNELDDPPPDEVEAECVLSAKAALDWRAWRSPDPDPAPAKMVAKAAAPASTTNGAQPPELVPPPPAPAQPRLQTPNEIIGEIPASLDRRARP